MHGAGGFQVRANLWKRRLHRLGFDKLQSFRCRVQETQTRFQMLLANASCPAVETLGHFQELDECTEIGRHAEGGNKVISRLAFDVVGCANQLAIAPAWP